MTEPNVTTVRPLADGEIAQIEVGGRPVAYARVGDRYFAIDDTCTHAKVSLAEGIVDEDDCTIECPKHGALFSLESGVALTLPATKGVAVHEIAVDGETVTISVAPEADDE